MRSTIDWLGLVVVNTSLSTDKPYNSYLCSRNQTQNSAGQTVLYTCSFLWHCKSLLPLWGGK